MSDRFAAAVERFATELLDDDRTTFAFADAESAARSVGCHPAVIIRGLRALGFTMETREPPRAVRGFRSNSHDRWYGPGSCPTHGGSGAAQIRGFASGGFE